jgi:hypothetical protein
MTMRAAIIGAGIGGLSAALALRQAGCAVTLFEQAERIAPMGAALSLWENAILPLRELGSAERKKHIAPIMAVSRRMITTPSATKMPARIFRATNCAPNHNPIANSTDANRRRARSANRHFGGARGFVWLLHEGIPGVRVGSYQGQWPQNAQPSWTLMASSKVISLKSDKFPLSMPK